MGTQDAIHAADRLSRVFEVISAEARAKPDFAARLLRALTDPADFGSAFEADQPSASDALSFSFVAVLHTKGESHLRDLLHRARDAEELLRLADEQHVPYDPNIAQAPLPEVVEGLIEGAKFRLSDRLAAAS